MHIIFEKSVVRKSYLAFEPWTLKRLKLLVIYVYLPEIIITS